MKAFPTASLLALASILGARSAAAQSGKPMKEEKPGLLALATVTPDSARKLALALVAHGSISEEEIEQEHGKLVFSFDIKVPGRSGIEEIQIDARSGAVVSREHETPRKVAQERAADARAAASKPKP